MEINQIFPGHMIYNRTLGASKPLRNFPQFSFAHMNANIRREHDGNSTVTTTSEYIRLGQRDTYITNKIISYYILLRLYVFKEKKIK